MQTNMHLSQTPTSVIDGDVEIDDISVDEWSLVGNSMTDDLIDGSAAGFGESVVVERRRITVSFHAGFVHDSVDLVRRHPDADRCRALVQDLFGEDEDEMNDEFSQLQRKFFFF